jgi:septum formation protein
MLMKKIILASASPRRKQLLKQIGLRFEIVVSNVDEVLDKRLTPRKQVELLSAQKAKSVAAQFKNAIVIGADSMIVIDGKIIGKPKNKEHAGLILRKLSGKMHHGMTGFTVIDTASGKTVTKSVVTKIWFKNLTDREIESYIEKEKPYDLAGSYGIGKLGAVLAEKVEGDFYNVVGLPLFTIAKELKKFKVEIL